MTCGLQGSRGAPEIHRSYKQGNVGLDWQVELGLIVKRNDIFIKAIFIKENKGTVRILRKTSEVWMRGKGKSVPAVLLQGPEPLTMVIMVSLMALPSHG